MTDFTIEDVRRILRDVAGADERVDLDGDIAATSFADLGYDSLALLEATARLQRDLSIRLPDDAVLAVSTPGQLIDLVSSTRAGALS
ncbi:actinorhodin polyketide synthase acyl carrier protein [Catellatospora sp. IY07-71]|uniref:acyl carrier protein n=1 Tax=Catellatospora sp. IY07-71 TaxID=2728827 RepID=UPI001BB36C76|nr:acyl carrier protein [Catellatospora sp. IY07-71]BCJ77770.1 actinorhodin polyketide synthase acyl carrier protein [Catellatospora sp. IY07-71]